MHSIRRVAFFQERFLELKMHIFKELNAYFGRLEVSMSSASIGWHSLDNVAPDVRIEVPLSGLSHHEEGVVVVGLGKWLFLQSITQL